MRAAVIAPEPFFSRSYGQSTDEGAVGEKLGTVAGRLLISGSGRLTLDAIADLLESSPVPRTSLRSRSLRPLRRMWKGLRGLRGGTRPGEHREVNGGRLSGLRLLRVLALCKDPRVLPLLQSHQRLCSAVRDISNAARDAAAAERAACVDSNQARRIGK